MQAKSNPKKTPDWSKKEVKMAEAAEKLREAGKLKTS